MSLDHNSPAPPLDAIEAFGNPWHGWVQGGTLRLPNGATRPWPQPTTGDTRLIAFPGLPEPRSAEQAAIDFAAGKQWRNTATLSGEEGVLYGQPIGTNAWIWRDASGARWRVSFPLGAVLNFGAGIDTTVSLARFGDFGQPSATASMPVVLADIGQSAPTLTLGPSGNDITSGLSRVVDTSSDGSRAIIEIVAGADSTLQFPPTQRWRPSLGYLEITLSGSVAGGAASAEIAVLRTRAQTVGTVTRSETDTRQIYYAVSGETETVLERCPNDAWRVIEYTPLPWVFGPFSSSHRGAMTAGSWSLSHATTRIVAMWYHDDTPEEVTYTVSHTASNVISLSGTVSGSSTLTRECGQTSTVVAGDTYRRIDQDAAGEAVMTASIHVGGVLADSCTWKMRVTQNRYVEWLPNVMTDPETVGTRAEEWEYNGTIVSSSTSFSAAMPETQPWTGVPLALYGTYGSAANRGTDYMAFALPGVVVGPDGALWSGAYLQPQIYSNHCVGLVIGARTEFGAPNSSLSVNQWRQIAHPGGVDPTVTTSPKISSNAVLNSGGTRYASWCPATGEVVRDKATPVCWV